jgi:antirestriction protein ArdC
VADNFVSTTGADIRHGGDQAYYQPQADYIQLPEEGLFIDLETRTRTQWYYGTLLHELVHWSGAKHRLSRDLNGRFGKMAYAAEELIAEIGAAFLCAELGITQDVRPDHAQYIATWLVLLKSDPKAIFTAAARASEASAFLHAKSKAAAAT